MIRAVCPLSIFGFLQACGHFDFGLQPGHWPARDGSMGVFPSA